jgi:putative AdoMet-dependent methyltransferase
MGREFIELFNEWAKTYEQTVNGKDPEYQAVFEGYETILDKVAISAKGNVLEFGVGTGNLMNRLIEKGHKVIGVEPSSEMRKIARERFPNVQILDGDFLNYPPHSAKINTIVSTYAFHHLTDVEKNIAIQNFSKLLSKDDQIVFADTVFTDEKSRALQIEKVEKLGYKNLLQDLQTEYYTTIDTLSTIFQQNGFDVEFNRLNEYVWFILATKK